MEPKLQGVKIFYLFFLFLYIYIKTSMAFNFANLLINENLSILENMPPIEIEKRSTDKKVLYNKNTNRLDRMAGEYYEDESLWKLILWANPEYDIEFDIPDNTVLRIPWPKEVVLDDVVKQIVNKKNIG